jgi:molybdopterin molybdotransferase
MATLEDARRLILGKVHTLGTESVDLLHSLGLVSAEDIIAPFDMPALDNSAMDGYAIRMEDLQGSNGLRVSGLITAGSTAIPELQRGFAIKIMTGGLMPPGADTVVPFEEAEANGDCVTFKKTPQKHQHVRFAGSDIKTGEVVISAGTLIRAPEISIMASLGKTHVDVFRRPRVAILSTGDELLEIGQPLVPGKVIDSNGIALAALVTECGAIAEPLGIARDTEASHVEKMTRGLDADIFITSAGVSVGERDLVRRVLEELGMTQVFHSVDVRPGGPTTFGVRGQCLVFCLPGNPVASMLMFDELVKPAILKTMGYRRIHQPLVRAALQDGVSKRPGRVKLLRVRVESQHGKLLAYVSGEQSTGKMKTLLRANAIAIIPSACGTLPAGAEVDVRMLSPNEVMKVDEEQ